MNQDEPEALVVAMQGDGASHPVSVIIRMRHDREEDTSRSHAMRIADAYCPFVGRLTHRRETA
jgi:hypothetical protein